jgi:hypothetical protein
MLMWKRCYNASFILGLILALAVSGCGGGSNSNSGGSSNTLTCTIKSSGSLDGVDSYIYTSMVSTSTTYSFDDTGSTITIGNNYSTSTIPPSMTSTSFTVCRCLLSFDLNTLAGKTITSATLKVYVDSTSGSPFNNSTLGNLTADHIDYGTATPSDLSSQNYFSGFSPTTVGSMTTDGQWQVIDVTSEVAADQTKGYTQYRLYFAKDQSDTETNKITIVSGDSATNQPELAVTYH